ncbi:unnamed protein product [Amoebophrya sp. A25]|nr:unnamed protein product [Amoebophrya sp. A25]|eukprot:GSA25T00000810001.1
MLSRGSGKIPIRPARPRSAYPHTYKRRFPAKSQRWFTSTATVPANGTKYDAIIVGGGVAGVNSANAFAKRGQKTLLLEQNSLTSGSTWHAAGLITHFKGNPLVAELAEYGGRVYRELQERGQDIGWHPTGSLGIARSDETAEALLGALQGCRYMGHEHRLLWDLKEAQKIHPFLENPGGDFRLAIHSPNDGIVNPADCTMAVAKQAREAGAEIREGLRVVGFGLSPCRTRIVSVRFVPNDATTGELKGVDFSAADVQEVFLNPGAANGGNVVIAASAWTRGLCRDELQEYLPLGYAPHQYTIFNRIEGVSNKLPVVRDYVGKYYLKPEVGGLMVGVFEGQPIPNGIPDFVLERSVTGYVPADASHELFEESLEKAGPEFEDAVNQFPVLQETEIKQWLHGPDTHTPDHSILVGPLIGLDNAFSAGGFNSQGIQCGPGVGVALSEWALDGYPRSFSNHFEGAKLARFNPDIANNDEWCAYRALESYGGTFEPHFPREADESVRGLAMKSPFHDQLIAGGGVFSEAFGWERPMYFEAGNKDLHSKGPTEWMNLTPHPTSATSVPRDQLAFAYKDSAWFAREQHEARHCRNEAVAFDMTPFGKVVVKGKDATKLANFAVCADVVNAEKNIVYTCFANDSGGILGDLTVCRIAADEYYCVVPAADPFEFLRHLRVCRDQLAKEEGTGGSAVDVEVAHVTRDVGTLAVMGPKTRGIFENMYPNTKFDDGSFPFSTMQDLEPGVRALRVSFAGTLGWELHVENAKAGDVYKRAFEAAKKANVDLQNAGMFSLLNSLRIEKAFPHNGHDTFPLVTPMEAGLAFCVDMKKPGKFRGFDALKERRKAGARQRICSFVLEDADASPHGHYAEIIYRRNPATGEFSQKCGYLTSGGYSHTLDKPIGLGFVSMEAESAETRKKPKKWLESGEYEIELVKSGKITRTPAKCDAILPIWAILHRPLLPHVFEVENF